MGRLILNADDLGYTPGVHRAVRELAEAGALTSATLMARGASFSEAVRDAEACVAVGCHVVLLDGVVSASPGEVPSLLDPLRAGEHLRPTLGGFVRDLLLHRIDDRELEREMVAQIRTLQAAGVHVSHVDTHKHTHIFPAVLRPLVRAALQCGVRAIRNPFEPRWARAATVRSGAAVPRLRRVQTSLLARWQGEFHRTVREAGLHTTDGALGVLATGVLDARTLCALLAAAEQREGTWELVCHPAYVDDELRRAHTRLRAEREVERTALLAAATSAPGLQRISFADLGS
jgi:chitin disaccharide deacetylase